MRHAGIDLWGRTMFVISLCVLLWVLPFFRASGECCGSHSIEPPSAQHGRDLGMAVSLQIDRAGEAWLDGRRVTRDDRGREELARALATRRSHWDVLSPGVAHDGSIVGSPAPGPTVGAARSRAVPARASTPAVGSVLVIADRRTRWGDIRPLVMVAAREGHPHLQLVVNAPEGAEDRLWEHFR